MNTTNIKCINGWGKRFIRGVMYERTIFQWLKDGKIEGIKWKNRRLINTISVMGFLLKKKSLEMKHIKEREIKREIEERMFHNLSYD